MKLTRRSMLRWLGVAAPAVAIAPVAMALTPATLPPAPSRKLDKLVWSGDLGIWVAMGTDGFEIQASPDGMTWTDRT